MKLHLPLQPCKIYANLTTGKDEIAIMRGPLVYCIEHVDNNVDVDDIALVDGPVTEGAAKRIATVDGSIPITTPGKQLTNNQWPTLYGSEPWKYSSTNKELLFVHSF